MGIRQCLLDADHDEPMHVYGSARPTLDPADPERCSHMVRVPLIPRADDDPGRLAELAARGLDADMNPPLTPQERDAAADPGLPAAAQESPMEPKPFVSPQLKRIATYVATFGGMLLASLPVIAGVVTLPAWLPFAVFALTSIAAFLAGLAMPSFSQLKPLVPLTAVPAIGGIAALLTQVAAKMEEGSMLKGGLLLVVALLAGLAGKLIPEPVVTPAKQPAPGEPQP